MEKGLLIAVSGFSGSGKGTIMKKIMTESPDRYALSVSATTRQPRAGETEGVEYFFKTKEEFEQLIKEDGLIEHAQYVGNYYGTPKDFVYEQMEKGKDVFLEIEVLGALQVKEKFPDTVLIFVMPPSLQELKRRLSERGSEDEKTIRKRIERAAEEAEVVDKYDYVLVNDDLDKAVARLKAITEAEHSKTANQKNILQQMRGELGGKK